MSRSDNSHKGAGYEMWSRRPMSGYSPSAENKRICHGIERAQAKQELVKEMSNFACDKCGCVCGDTTAGYITGCQHYPPDAPGTADYKACEDCGLISAGVATFGYYDQCSKCWDRLRGFWERLLWD